MKRAVLGIALLLAVQGVAILLYLSVKENRKAKEPFLYEKLSGAKTAPELSFFQPRGISKLSSYQGKFVLLHFWATWCGPCRQELPVLLTLSRDLKKEGLVLLAVSVDSEWSKVESFFDGAVPPEIFFDQTGEAKKAFEVTTLPDTYLIGPDGTLAIRVSGAREWTSAGAYEALQKELKNPTK